MLASEKHFDSPKTQPEDATKVHRRLVLFPFANSELEFDCFALAQYSTTSATSNFLVKSFCVGL
jgi:hypothetical protein